MQKLSERVGRLDISVDADEDPEAVTQLMRQYQRSLGIAGRRQKLADAQRDRRLATFAAEHGTGEKALVIWNRENPDDRYSGRQAFWKAAKRATVRARTDGVKMLAKVFADEVIIDDGDGAPVRRKAA